ncbi:hypothetical protein MM35RIKEN_19530 (plasmid) [Vescimonas fastidiosa]|uniref:Uncharacterized protein n=1 Tax=Vescimonas fastidiosa TaxID=2714353 RepID=A0A810Q2T0_9FIRM|nr:hypothetical protein MM35RIKEN_19530 [Vescimonas fastidiosa]
MTHYIRVSLAWGIFFCKKEAALFTKALQKKGCPVGAEFTAKIGFAHLRCMECLGMIFEIFVEFL